MSQRRFILKLTKDYIIPTYKSCDEVVSTKTVSTIDIYLMLFDFI